MERQLITRQIKNRVRLRFIKRKLLPVMLAVSALVFLLAGCGGLNGGSNKKDDKEKTTEQNTVSHEDIPQGPVIQGPDIPPDGMRYDAWKGFEYTKDTEFNLRSFWASKNLSNGIVQDNEFIEDAVLKIVDAHAEPVGGEMKLRSGGYVDVTIEFLWTGTMMYTADDEMLAYYNSFSWMENKPLPCDAYTGTSLLNSIDTDESNDEAIHVGEAMETQMTESTVTWEGRTWRLFAKSDVRNASFDGGSVDRVDGKFKVTFPGVVEITLTCRIPADYDGLVIAIDKDITDEKQECLTDDAEWINVSDTYADVLTTDSGRKQTAEDYYFIKVSDLLEKFDN